MKDLVNKLIPNFHFIILLYGAWTTWGLYEQHAVQLEQVEGQIPGIETEISNTNRKIKEIEEFTKKTSESKIRVEQVVKNIEESQRQLPAEINDGQIIFFFNQEINSLNIKDPSIVPGTESVSTYYISKDYTLKIKGTFLQLLIFFERIGNSARIFNIKSLKLVADTSNQKGRFQLVLGEGVIQAFRFNPDFKVDIGFSTDNKQ